MAMMELQNVNKYYGQGIGRVHVLKDVNFKANAGEMNLILGPSGSGKSTFNDRRWLTNTNNWESSN